jgi:hypothetical protein
MNALQSGLDADSQFVIGEDRADFHALGHEYFQMIRPRNPRERFYMDRMLRNEWLLRRMFRAESHVWEYHTMRANRSEGVPLGEAWDELRRLRGGSAPLPLDGDLATSAEPLFPEPAPEPPPTAPEPLPQLRETTGETA